MVELTFTLEDLLQLQHAAPATGTTDDVLLVHALAAVEVPALGLYTTREITLVSSYSWFIWSMGGSMTFVVAEQEHCANALILHGSYSFEGPYDVRMLAQSHESGQQAVVGTQDD